MVELGQLEKQHAEFAKRNVRVIVISNDKPTTAQATQADFPHLVVVSDSDQNMARALQVIHSGAGATGEDTNAPTTFLVDSTGHVHRMLRPERFITRYSPQEVLAAIDAAWNVK
jgi:peroxiredoxin